MMLIPKSKSNRIQILVLILAGLILQPAHASVIPGRWEKASNLKVDAPITIKGTRRGQSRSCVPWGETRASLGGRRVNRTRFVQVVVDHSSPASLAPSGGREAQFPDTARARNFILRERILREEVDQFVFLILTEQLVSLTGERRSLGHRLHRTTLYAPLG